MACPPSYPRSRKTHRETVPVVVPPGLVHAFARWSRAKFAAPDEQSLIPQSGALEAEVLQLWRTERTGTRDILASHLRHPDRTCASGQSMSPRFSGAAVSGEGYVVAGFQLAGSNSSSLVTGCVAIRPRTSRRLAQGPIFSRWQDAMKLISTATGISSVFTSGTNASLSHTRAPHK